MSKDRSCAFVAAAACLLMSFNALADEIYSARSQISLPGGQQVTSFDTSFVDPVLGLYLLADRTNTAIDVIDTTTNTVLVQLAATPPFAGAMLGSANEGPNGIVTVNNREVWAGDGHSQVKVIDLFSQQTTHVIDTGGGFRADHLCFDPVDQLVLVANTAESPFPFVSVISTVNYSILQRITMNGTVNAGQSIAAPPATDGIEQCQWDSRTGRFYLNIPEVGGPGNGTADGAVVVFSPQPNGTLKIDNVLDVPVSECALPLGMTIGPKHQILLGCGNPNKTVPSTIIINDEVETGATAVTIIATVANQDGADEVWFNVGNNSYFLARDIGSNPQQLGIIDAGDKSEKLGPDQSVVVGRAAHSVAADPAFNQTYMPIPSTAGLSVCSNAGGSDAQGCIAVFTAASDDPATVAKK
jgi:hypothetical protein